jgi:glycosyl transferase family 87
MRACWILLCGVLPLLILYYTLAPNALGDHQVVDFRFAFYPAAENVLDGEQFYPVDGFVLRGTDDFIIDYVYPPLVAVLTVPWTILPVGTAEVLFQLFLVAALVGTLALLGVRDWRCYGLTLLWPPVIHAIATGNVSILLGLVAAVVWACRDRAFVSGTALGVSIAAKPFLWPLTIWLALTGRVRSALWSVGVATVTLVGSWAVVGFRGFSEYPDLVQRLTDRMDERSYTVYALGVDLGLPANLAWSLWLANTVAVLGACVMLARRGDDRRAFVLALAAAIAFSPIVWLHYFTLLLVVVAIAEPRLAPIWFLGIPLQVVVSTGAYNGSTFQTAAVLLVAVVIFALALAPRSWRLGGTPDSPMLANYSEVDRSAVVAFRKVSV